MPIKQLEAEPETAGLGHNKPPIEDDVRAQFKEALLDERPDFLARVESIEEAADRVAVTDEDTLGKAGDFVKMIRAAEKHVSDTHVAVKAPYLAAGRTADAEKNALVTRLNTAKAKAEKPMNAYVAKREAERQAALRLAEQQRREAEAKARAAEEERRWLAEKAAALNAPAPAPVPEPVYVPEVEPVALKEPTRSDGGTTVSAHTVWHAEITDFNACFGAVEDDERVRVAVQKAIEARVRAGARKIAGVRIYSTAKAVSV